MDTAVRQPLITSEDSDLSVALVHSQNEDWSLPIRGYLEGHGCRVTYGNPFHAQALYTIVCGDKKFVESIITLGKKYTTQVLLIVWNTTTAINKTFIDASVKIVYLDYHALTLHEVEQIFDFFFTSSVHILDLRMDKEVLLDEPLPRQKLQEKISEKIEKPLQVKPETDMPPRAIYSDSLDYVPLQKNVEESNSESLTQQDQKRVRELMADIFHKPDDQESKRKKRTRTFSWTQKLFFIVLFALSPIFFMELTIGISALSLGLGARGLQEGKPTQAKIFQTVASWSIAGAKSMLEIVHWPLVLIGRPNMMTGQERIVSFLSQSENSIEGIQEVFAQAHDLGSGFFLSGPDTSATPVMIEKLRSQVTLVTTRSGLAQAQLAQLLIQSPFPFSIKIVHGYGQKGISVINTLRHNLENLDHFLTLYPKVAGFTSPQTFLLLFQNSMELRPTGGFIGSVGILTVSGGHMSDLTIHDVYELDGQLKGHVDPPKPISQLLEQEHWYLRDSNWDPDFLISGEKAAWFYEKETGTRVDGVIAINTPFLVELLRLLGPVTLTDYNDQITADNFFGKSLYYTQADFFPGSTQKKDFIGTLARVMLDRLTSEKNLDSARMFHALAKTMEAHDLLFYFTDNDPQRLVEQYGWGGLNKSTLCLQITACFTDEASVVEANLGVNKANYFMQGSLLFRTTIDESGRVNESLTHTLKNTATPQTDGTGVYTSYTRYFLAKEATISSVLLDGNQIAQKSNETDSGLPYGEFLEDLRGDMLVYGFAQKVAPEHEARITLSYGYKKPLLFENDTGIYTLFIRKQPGLGNQDVTIKIGYPASWKATVEDPSASDIPRGVVATDGQFQYNTTLSRDLMLKIAFTK